MRLSRTTILGIVFVLLIFGTGGILFFNSLNIPTTGEPVTIFETTVPPVPALKPDSVAWGEKLYAQYCASCHGANLEGVPNWKLLLPDDSFPPPPHDDSGHTWHHPDELLIEIIANGGDTKLFNATMPGFGNQLTDKEMIVILDFIKSRWNKENREYQWWITAREELP